MPKYQPTLCPEFESRLCHTYTLFGFVFSRCFRLIHCTTLRIAVKRANHSLIEKLIRKKQQYREYDCCVLQRNEQETLRYEGKR